MMGGQWFEDQFGDPDKADPGDFTEKAIKRLEVTLGIKKAPLRVLSSIQKDCIPQYFLGHSDLLRTMSGFIDEHHIPLSLIGSSYHGAAVNDCILNAHRAVDRVVRPEV